MAADVNPRILRPVWATNCRRKNSAAREYPDDVPATAAQDFYDLQPVVQITTKLP
jgi:hypothetical protein